MANNVICLSPLKFYSGLKYQNHRKPYAFGQIFPLLMPYGMLLPFQFVLHSDVSSQSIDKINIYDASTDVKVGEITSATSTLGLTYKTVNDSNLCILPTTYVFTSQQLRHEGIYYLGLVDNRSVEAYYSEVFCMTNSLNDCIKIEYRNPEANFKLNNGAVSFDDNFRFILYLRTTLGKPEYKFDEQATDRLGYTFVETQTSKKIYKFNVLAPEYLCDAMRIIRMCSNKVLTSQGEEYDMITFELDVSWQEQGDVASVDCEFEVDNVIVNLGGYS